MGWNTKLFFEIVFSFLKDACIFFPGGQRINLKLKRTIWLNHHFKKRWGGIGRKNLEAIKPGQRKVSCPQTQPWLTFSVFFLKKENFPTARFRCAESQRGFMGTDRLASLFWFPVLPVFI